MFHAVAIYAIDFLGITASISLFFAPFLGVFIWRNRRELKAKRPHFNYFMERFFISPESNALVFCWAAAEAFWWFIIPEFLLILLVFMKIRRKFDLIIYDIAGTVVGTLIAFTLRLPDSFYRHLPFIRPKMLTQVEQWYRQMGVWGLLHQPFSGVPYKIFIHEATTFHLFFIWFMVIAIIARLFRYVILYEVAQALYPLLHRFVRKHYANLFIGAIAIFTLLLLHVVAIYQ